MWIPIPSLLIWVKSFPRIDLLDEAWVFLCKLPSTCIPQAPVFADVQFWMYGEAVLILPLGSSVITPAISTPLGIVNSPTSGTLNLALPNVMKSLVVNPWLPLVLTVNSPVA